LAAIIASQAVISGAFSITMQAMQLGYWAPRDPPHEPSAKIGQTLSPAGELGAHARDDRLVVFVPVRRRALAARIGIAVSGTISSRRRCFHRSPRSGEWTSSAPALLSAARSSSSSGWVSCFANLLKDPQGRLVPAKAAFGPRSSS